MKILELKNYFSTVDDAKAKMETQFSFLKSRPGGFTYLWIIDGGRYLYDLHIYKSWKNIKIISDISKSVLYVSGDTNKNFIFFQKIFAFV